MPTSSPGAAASATSSSVPSAAVTSALVDIIREFLEAHQMLRRVFDRYRRGDLDFQELEQLVGDDERTVLYRLKERCHALFRPDDSSQVAMRREVLFDLAVGSLFHEAMKFRENYYQREVYGPRVRALRSQAGEDSDRLFQEFEKILAAVSARLEEGQHEADALLDQTRDQLGVLLEKHRENGFVARCLLENRESVEEVFGESLDRLLERIHGDAAHGFALAGRSYLTSGYYGGAERAFAEALARGGEPDQLDRFSAYARGMTAFQQGAYGESVRQLGLWLAAGSKDDPRLLSVAETALSKVGELVEEDGRASVTADAESLVARLHALRAAEKPS